MTLGLGLLVFFWGTGFVRNYGGDAIVVVFLYNFLSIFWDVPPWKKALTVFLFALSIEFLPLFVDSSPNPLHELIIGSTVDPRDILTYLVTTITILLFNKKRSSRFST